MNKRPFPLRQSIHHSGAFSLLELLVVIAMVSLLACLLLPALGKCRRGAQQVQCVSNLHQLGIATQLYWDDHDGFTFRYKEVPAPGADGDLYWFGWLERGAEGNRRFDARRGVLFPYLAGRGVELCPALRYAQADFKMKAYGAAYGYGYNLELSSTPARPNISSQQVRRPSEVVLFADAAQVNDFQAPASPDHPMLEEFYYVNSREPTTHFRHRDRANLVFIDGHVGAETAAPGSLDTRLPGETVGFLRAELLQPR